MILSVLHWLRLLVAWIDAHKPSKIVYVAAGPQDKVDVILVHSGECAFQKLVHVRLDQQNLQIGNSLIAKERFVQPHCAESETAGVDNGSMIDDVEFEILYDTTRFVRVSTRSRSSSVARDSALIAVS